MGSIYIQILEKNKLKITLFFILFSILIPFVVSGFSFYLGLDPRYFLFDVSQENSYINNAGHTETQFFGRQYLRLAMKVTGNIICGTECFFDSTITENRAIAHWFLLLLTINFLLVLIVFSNFFLVKNINKTTKFLLLALTVYFFYFLANQLALSNYYGEHRIIKNGEELALKDNNEKLTLIFRKTSSFIRNLGEFFPLDFHKNSKPLYEKILIYPNSLSFSLDELALFWLGHYTDIKTIQIIENSSGKVVFGNIDENNYPHYLTGGLFKSRNYQLYMYDIQRACNLKDAERLLFLKKIFNQILSNHNHFFDQKKQYKIVIGEIVYNFDPLEMDIVKKEMGLIEKNEISILNADCPGQNLTFGIPD